MSYSIEWQEHGAVKHYSGDVTFADVMNSEREITGWSNFTSLKYVVLDYLGARQPGLTESELLDIRALRLGGFYSNPRIKYAFVTVDLRLRATIERGVADGQYLHDAQVFATFDEAFAWVSRRDLIVASSSFGKCAQ
jgi:hypothetical protein